MTALAIIPTRARTKGAPVATSRYPLCKKLLEDYAPLSRDQEGLVTFERRFASVAPFVVDKAARFVSTLRDRQVANMDLEDVVSECWIELRTKDPKFDPSRAKYITFVGKVIRNLFADLRDTARTVHAPSNSGWRMRDYRQAEAEGRLTERQAATARKVRMARAEAHGLGDQSHQSHSFTWHGSSEPVGAAADREKSRRVHAVVIRVVCGLPPYEAAVVGSLLGLWGADKKSAPAIAAELGREADEVRRITARTKNLVRHALAAEGLAPPPDEGLYPED